MIQRIQTLWMLLTALLVGAVIFLTVQNSDYSVWLVVILGLAAFVPLETIFLYKNRSRQTSHLIAEFVLLAGCAGFTIYYAWFAHTTWVYSPVLILAAFATNWLALRGVLHDEMMVRGADRIR